MNKQLFLFAFLFLSTSLMGKTVTSYRLNEVVPPKPGLAGNGVTDIQASDGIIWFGTGHGLSRTTDDGETFESFGTRHGMTKGSISALWTSGDTVIVATAGDTLTDVADDYLPMGNGLSISYDNGLTWQRIEQPGPTPVQNLTYDLTVHHGSIWIASFGGGVQRSDDWGQSWVEVAPDTFIFDPGKRLNHRGFSVISSGDALWVGTAGGINKSTDNGLTWTNFNATNQEQPISGNFVVALAVQRTAEKEIVWAATWKAEGEKEFYAISKSENGGLSWQTMLHEEKAHNFGFDGATVYVATDNGLYKSPDYGENWFLFPRISDPQTGEMLFTTETYSAYGRDGDLWVGTADGLARTRDNGYTWQIVRAFVPTGQGNTPRTYAYPNPFSPMRHNQLDNDGYVRIQYNTLEPTTVTIKVFDFAMDLVTTVVENKSTFGPGDHWQVWNGRNDYGDAVANGVYFYSVDIADDGVYWGKIMIIN